MDNQWIGNGVASPPSATKPSTKVHQVSKAVLCTVAAFLGIFFVGVFEKWVESRLEGYQVSNSSLLRISHRSLIDDAFLV